MDLPEIKVEFDYGVIPKEALDLDERLRTVTRHVMSEQMADFTIKEVQRQIKKFGLDEKGQHSALYNSISWDFKVTGDTVNRYQIDGRVYSKLSRQNPLQKVRAIETGRNPHEPPPPVEDIADWTEDVLKVLVRQQERQRRQKQLRKHEATVRAARKAHRAIPPRPRPKTSALNRATEDQLAFVIARKIGEEGTPAKPIFGGAFYHIDRGVTRRFIDALNQEL